MITRHHTKGDAPSVAVYSDCERYRYSLSRVWDADGRRYLDAYNNVPHVGHCHPKVVEALLTQARLLNTNTRYLNDQLTALAARLAATLPEPLQTCFFLNSASERSAVRCSHSAGTPRPWT